MSETTKSVSVASFVDEPFVFDLAIQDSLWSKTVFIMAISAYIGLGYFVSSKFLRLSDSENTFCNPDSITFMWMYAWLFGKSAKDEINKCLKKDNNVVVRTIQDPLVQLINEKKTEMDAKMKVLDSNYAILENAYNKSEGKTNNLAIALENNILAVKEAIQKIVAAFVIRNHMNDGAIAVNKKLSNHDALFTKALERITSNKADVIKTETAASTAKKAANSVLKAVGINKKAQSNIKKAFTIKKKK